MSVVIETTIGDLTVDLFIEERPKACLNFVKLCQLKYFNYNLFHSIQRDFIAQTGDPTGAGEGGSSVWGVIEGVQKRFVEVESVPKILHSSVGLLSLVSPQDNLVGSQFFFTLGADLTSLDGQHIVIGEVVEGHETLRLLNEAIVDEKCRPYQDIRITHTVVLHDPFPNMRGFKAPSRSPSPTVERLQNGRIAADEDIDDTEGKSMEEIQEMLAEREAKARATILEIVGDLPDAEAAPPENVLFVCKLNPVTTEDDLEIIFGRFGKIVSCEVIRDKKSGDSLQYAFVEYENEKACEAAYFKMNNVLIDDRRIHVDFSQSVARVKWRGKGRGVIEQHGPLDFNNLRGHNKSSRLTDEERKKQRENRHREQKEREKRRSQTRSPVRRNTRRSQTRSPVRKNTRRSRSRSPRRRQERWEDSRTNRFNSRMKVNYQRRDERSRSRDFPGRREIDTKRDYQPRNNSRQEDFGQRHKHNERRRSIDVRDVNDKNTNSIEQSKKENKKRKHKKKDSSTESDASDDDSDSSQNSSSSSEESVKKRKTSKHKRTKHKKNKKKQRKHKK